MKPLTTRQAEVLRTIMDTVEARGYPPTTRELMETLGYSAQNSITRHLDAIEAKGYISREPSCARSIRVFADWHGERVVLSYSAVSR